MKQLLSIPYLKERDRWQWLVVACCLCLFVGLACARALASIGMIGLLVAPFLFNKPADIFKNYFSQRALWILSFFFFIVLASGIYSADKQEWLNWVRIKLPYIALPVAFAGISKLDTKKFVVVLYGFIITFFVTTVVILIRYALNYDAITDSYYQGAAMPIPYSHIRYSLMLAFSFFCAVYIYSKQHYLFSRHEKWLQLFFAAFAFVSLHVLSVRSGLLALYLGILYLAFYIVFSYRKYVLGLSLIAAMVAMPSVAYHIVPSFHNKIHYMQYDLNEYRHGSYNNLSDGIRIVSTMIGIEVWQKQPVIGVGAGDIRDEVQKIYAEKYPQITEPNRKVPHNQIVWVLASTGIIGLVFFLIAFFVPLFSNQLFKFWPALVLHLILFSSFFTEDTFEEQIGTGFYLIFLLLFMNYHHTNE